MGRRGMHIGDLWGSQKERGHWEDRDVGEWIILKSILIGWDGVDWSDVAQDRDWWRALVNTVFNIRAP
jgi:hypothetical protein